MIPRGADNLFTLRMQGYLPDSVWVEFGPGKTRDWASDGFGPMIRVLPADPIQRLDLRCLVGLDVIYEPAEWNDKAAELYERMQEYAKTITVVSLSLKPEMGWAWDHKFGQRGLGELQWIEKYAEAKSDCVHWAHKNKPGKYAAAKAREDQILRDNAWLIS
jgi:hypothetical protein